MGFIDAWHLSCRYVIMKSVLKYFVTLLLLFFTACSSAPVNEALNRVRVGMDKDDVLNIAGNPKHSFRAGGKDHWIYSYYVGDTETHRQFC